ncbi:MAG TPA: sugar ABC transporter ATP-binding protein [Thermodesulfobacteriota bacterium]|nr:sugar ABC transporter ATP-binding protein [Thermodesulfobacteriota bacterium]
MASLLEAVSLTKTFPGVKALANVDFDIQAGEVHVLLGENGAGKSTLVKILTGIYHPDSGDIRIHGKPVRLRSPIEAFREGIAAIHQEFAIVPYLDAATNIFLGRTPCRGPLGIVDRGALYRDAQKYLDSLEAGIDARTIVNDLGVGKRQLVEIAKALSASARILFMDEPTSALTHDERAHLFKTIRELKSKGLGIVYSSHKLEEVHEIGDRVTVLRDGEKISTLPVSEVTVDELIQMMVGRQMSQKFQKEQVAAGETAFEVRRLSRKGVLRDISFSVRKGEIVGLAGLVGAGRTELAQCLFGVDPIDSGEIYVQGKPVAIRNPRDAISNGIALLTENRKKQGLFMSLDVQDNIAIPAINAVRTASAYVRRGVIHRDRQRRVAEDYVSRLRIKTPSLFHMVSSLSGGNQQKVILAKWLALNPRFIIFDEPTRGIDVGAKTEIYLLMESLLKQGIGVLMISSELPEIIALSDRILVLAKGRITGEFTQKEATQEKIMACAVKVA